MIPLNDPLLPAQWHISNRDEAGEPLGYDLNVVPAWERYSGAGIRVAVVNSGVDYTHDDLAANYDHAASYDAVTGGTDVFPYDGNAHGTAIAGLIAADNANGFGGVGVAPDATLISIRNCGSQFNIETFLDATAHVLPADADVASNSWGFGRLAPFFDNFNNPSFVPFERVMSDIARYGRDELGAVQVFCAGNQRLTHGDRVDYHSIQASRFVITVAAIDQAGNVSEYSNPGASNLVSAFGTPGEVVTTDIAGLAGYTDGDFTYKFNGTSAATPMVAGVVALMLEANPALGYRDVQEILAYSSRFTVDDGSWQINGADDYNGGGLPVSDNFGFGLVDAHAATRLAETWTTQHTYLNEEWIEATSPVEASIPDASALSDSIELDIGEGFKIDHVEVDVNLAHEHLGDLSLRLVSPAGTRSVLMDRPGRTEENSFGMEGGELNFTFTSTQHWGESPDGTWELHILDSASSDDGYLAEWTLRTYGDTEAADDTYIYTDGYRNGRIAEAGTDIILDDEDGGHDTINASAVTSDLVLDLRTGNESTIAHSPLQLDGDAAIESAIAGDGNDQLVGNDLDNTLFGGRGDDELRGGPGDDALTGGEGADIFRFASGDGTDTITDFDLGDGDRIHIDHLAFGSLEGVAALGFDDDDGAVLPIAEDLEVVFAGMTSAAFDDAMFVA